MATEQESQCPLCHSQAQCRENPAIEERTFSYTCPVCGFWACRRIVKEYQIIGMDERDKSMLAAFLNDRKIQEIEITFIQGNDNFGGGTPSWAKDCAFTISAALETMRPIFDSPTQKVDKALLKLARLSIMEGREVLCDHPAVLYSESNDDFHFVLSSLEKKGYSDVAFVFGVRGSLAKLTLDGWNRVEELLDNKGRQAFVAMSFDSSMDEVYGNGIQPAIRDAGYSPLLVKESTAPVQITDEIKDEIAKSRFLVADFTGQKGGVYFEAGYALGLGIPVIWTVQKEELPKLHFDIRQYRHIDWIDPEDLRSRLLACIKTHISKVRGAE